MYLHELPELIDELETISIDIPTPVWEEIDPIDFQETCFYILNDYIEHNPTLLSEPTFQEDFYEDFIELLSIQFEDQLLNDDFFEEDLFLITEEIFEMYLECFSYIRSHFDFIHVVQNKDETDELGKKIEYLRRVPQPVQRTPEWYEKRHNLITASNAYKVFEKEGAMNQIIYEKCKPIMIEENPRPPNLSSPLHWGQKYEPLSVMIYEYLYNTQVEEFGCIPHNDYPFLGASPDGIIINKDSDRYGRMLEIKNIVNREITGIPKKEYWIQMQLQMEVCDLDYCDFLETKFTEITDYQSFMSEAKEPHTHGIILYFSRNMKPYYIYKPLNITEKEKIDEWTEQTIQDNSGNESIWIQNIYWKLEKMSCVLVERNKNWFQNNISQIEKVWNIILHERKNGYEHRAPKKTVKPDKPLIEPINNCLLNIIKIDTEKLHS
jgi:putative phage-type endonuclease